MFPCSQSSARLNKICYETGHYKIGFPCPWSFKKPFLSPSPHWICLFWTQSVRCDRSFSERLDGWQHLLGTIAAYQRSPRPAFSLASHYTLTASIASVHHGPYIPFLLLPMEYLRGCGFSDSAVPPNRGRTPQILWLVVTCLQEGSDSHSTSRTVETVCTRWVGFVHVFKMAALSFCLVLDPPPVSKPQKLGVHGEKMLPHSWAALLGLCEESQANQPSSNFRNRAVVAQLCVCCKEHALLCFPWKDRSSFFSENQNNNKCSK